MGAALVFLALAGLVVLFGFVWQKWAEARDSRLYPPPGSFLQPPGARLHIQTAGSGQPVVILEAGIAGSSVGWARVLPALARITRVCAYDRPGLAWSSGSAHPRTPEQYVQELQAVLQQAGAPAVLVGHSFGALLVRLYASRYPAQVAGLVLVDPALLLEWADPSPGRLRTLRRGVTLSRRGAWLARIGFVRLALKLLSGGSRRLPKLFARLSSGSGGAPVTERLVGEVRKLPPELWPVVQSHWVRAKSFRSMADHLASLPAVAAAVNGSAVPADIPVTVISGAHLRPDELQEHARLARSFLRGRHVVAAGSAHWVHLDRPDLIVDAVAEILRNHG